MNTIGVLSMSIILLTGICTFLGIRKSIYYEYFCFDVGKITQDKQYHRLITPGLLHVDWLHYFFNMILLAAFGNRLELELGMLGFVLLYTLSLIGGGIMALIYNFNDKKYRGLGASGAIIGIVFSSMILFPSNKVKLLITPLDFQVDTWVIGIIYLLFVGYQITYNRNILISHETHLGGALTGLIFTILYIPSLVWLNSWVVGTLLVLTVTLISAGYFIHKNNEVIDFHNESDVW